MGERWGNAPAIHSLQDFSIPVSSSGDTTHLELSPLLSSGHISTASIRHMPRLSISTSVVCIALNILCTAGSCGSEKVTLTKDDPIPMWLGSIPQLHNRLCTCFVQGVWRHQLPHDTSKGTGGRSQWPNLTFPVEKPRLSNLQGSKVHFFSRICKAESSSQMCQGFLWTFLSASTQGSLTSQSSTMQQNNKRCWTGAGTRIPSAPPPHSLCWWWLREAPGFHTLCEWMLEDSMSA